MMYHEGFGFVTGCVAGNDFVAESVPAASSKVMICRPQALGICNQKHVIPIWAILRHHVDQFACFLRYRMFLVTFTNECELTRLNGSFSDGEAGQQAYW